MGAIETLEKWTCFKCEKKCLCAACRRDRIAEGCEIPLGSIAKRGRPKKKVEASTQPQKVTPFASSAPFKLIEMLGREEKKRGRPRKSESRSHCCVPKLLFSTGSSRPCKKRKEESLHAFNALVEASCFFLQEMSSSEELNREESSPKLQQDLMQVVRKTDAQHSFTHTSPSPSSLLSSSSNPLIHSSIPSFSSMAFSSFNKTN